MKIESKLAEKILNLMNRVNLIGAEAPIFMDIVNILIPAVQNNTDAEVNMEIINNILVFITSKSRLTIDTSEAKEFVAIQNELENKLNECKYPKNEDNEPKMFNDEMIEEIKKVSNNSTEDSEGISTQKER